MKEICDLLICPKCDGQLKENVKFLECDCCHNRIERELNAVMFAEKSNSYWGEITQSDMKRVLRMARFNGWKQAVSEIIQEQYPNLSYMILGGDRIDWLHLLNVGTNLTILDVGSGWGQTSFLLAKHETNTVISLEKIRERALFQAVRKEQERTDNLQIVNGDFLNARFRPNSFNIIILIGVLEWIGANDHPENPRTLQLGALQKAHELLKDGGFVCIGIENRIGFNNFLGAKDHSGLRFTSLMPRFLANIYMSLRKPSYRSNIKSGGYRTYTYSPSGYQKLLKEAGFQEIDIHVAYPHYAHPSCLIEMNNRAIRQFFTRVYRPTSAKNVIFSIGFRFLSRLNIGHLFAPQFIIFGRK